MKKSYCLLFAFCFVYSIATCFASDKADMSDEEIKEFKPQPMFVIENNEKNHEFHLLETNQGALQIPSTINIDNFFDEDDSSDDWLTKDNPFNGENKNTEIEKVKNFTIGEKSFSKKNSNSNRKLNKFNNKRNYTNSNKKSNK